MLYLDVLLERASFVTWSFDLRARRLRYLSPAYESVTGRDLLAAMKAPADALAGVPPEDAGRLRAALRACLKRGRAVVECRYARADGRLTRLRTEMIAVGEGRHVVSLVGTTHAFDASDSSKAHAVEAADPSRTSAREPLAGRRILVAEDFGDIRELIVRILREADAEVEAAGDGAEAVARASSQPFDAVLMDLEMPTVDGYEATRELRRRGFLAPIIALSAHAMRDARDRSKAAGCTDHLPKPFTRDQLVQKVAKHLAVRR